MEMWSIGFLGGCLFSVIFLGFGYVVGVKDDRKRISDRDSDSRGDNPISDREHSSLGGFDNGLERKMRDEQGWEIPCKYSEWKIVDERDNHDYVCTKYFAGGLHYCYCDDHCKDYVPVKKGQTE